jgi:putative DNA primase/helicase
VSFLLFCQNLLEGCIMLNLNDAEDQVVVTPRKDNRDMKKEIEQAVYRKLDQALFSLFPNGETTRHQFLIGDVHGNEGESLKVEMEGVKAGQWYDFATGEGGDIFRLWGLAKGWDERTHFPEIICDMQKWLGISVSENPHAREKKKKDEYLGPPTGKWDYHDEEGHLIACVYRYDTSTGKEFRPWDVKAQKYKAPDPRPLYNKPGILQSDSVIVVEGEKCAEALIGIGMCATTAMGGANAPIDKTDWSPLKGKHVLVWPDNDGPGKEYGDKLAAWLHHQPVLSLSQVHLPDDLPEKWDAADAVAEGRDIEVFLKHHARMVSLPSPDEILSPKTQTSPVIPHQSFAEWLDEPHSMPYDLIEPRILTPGGILLFGGAPKVGKTDFMLNWLVRLSAGLPFLGMNTPRPLKIFYFQSEIDHDYMRERLRNIPVDPHFLPLMRENLVITDSIRMLLDQEGIKHLLLTIQQRFVPDLIVIDPLRNVYPGASENDNMEMMGFLQDGIKALKDTLNPRAGMIIVHHTRKISKNELTDDPFQAFSGAGVLRSFYTSGLILYRPDEQQELRHLCFELRNGAPIPMKHVDKLNGEWCEMKVSQERIIRKKYGAKCDQERERIWDRILQIIADEARKGYLYTPGQFSHAFVKEGLGGARNICSHINNLCTLGYIKFNKEWKKTAKSKSGVMCVENMKIPLEKPVIDPETNEVIENMQIILPTHFKDIHNGNLYPVENPEVWIYRENITDIEKHQNDQSEFED